MHSEFILKDLIMFESGCKDAQAGGGGAIVPQVNRGEWNFKFGFSLVCPDWLSVFHPLRGQIRGEIDKPATGEGGTMVNVPGHPVFYFLVDILAGSRIIVARRAGDPID